MDRQRLRTPVNLGLQGRSQGHFPGSGILAGIAQRDPGRNAGEAHLAQGQQRGEDRLEPDRIGPGDSIVVVKRQGGNPFNPVFRPALDSRDQGGDSQLADDALQLRGAARMATDGSLGLADRISRTAALDPEFLDLQMASLQRRLQRCHRESRPTAGLHLAIAPPQLEAHGVAGAVGVERSDSEPPSGLVGIRSLPLKMQLPGLDPPEAEELDRIQSLELQCAFGAVWRGGGGGLQRVCRTARPPQGERHRFRENRLHIPFAMHSLEGVEGHGNAFGLQIDNDRIRSPPRLQGVEEKGPSLESPALQRNLQSGGPGESALQVREESGDRRAGLALPDPEAEADRSQHHEENQRGHHPPHPAAAGMDRLVAAPLSGFAGLS